MAHFLNNFSSLYRHAVIVAGVLQCGFSEEALYKHSTTLHCVLLHYVAIFSSVSLRRFVHLPMPSLLALALVVLIAAFVLAEGSLRAATNLHQDLLEHSLRSPMSFFDSTPVGRILNRFSKDIDVVDTAIPMSIDSWAKCTLSVLGTLFVISFSTPWFLVIIIPVGILYYLIQVLYCVSYINN